MRQFLEKFAPKPGLGGKQQCLTPANCVGEGRENSKTQALKKHGQAVLRSYHIILFMVVKCLPCESIFLSRVEGITIFFFNFMSKK